MKIRLLVFCLTTLAVPISAFPTFAATPVNIAGTIKNGTGGAGLPSAALGVTAVQLTDSNSEADRRQANAASDGTFRFDGLDLDRGKRFIVGVDYLGVTYSTFIEPHEGETELRADLTIYEQTDDESKIRVTSDILTAVKGDEDTLEVIQLIRVANNSDRTFVGKVPPRESQNAAVLTFPVPQGSFDVTPLEGLTQERMAAAAQGFTGGDPVLPGENKFSYLYKVRVPRGGWILQRAVIYPTARSEILVGEGLEAVSEEFEYVERTKVGGKFYKRYTGGAWQAGSEWPVSIRREGGSQTGIWIGAGLGLALVGALGAGTIFYRRRRSTEPSASVRAAEDRERLIEEIAKLDVRFERGGIDKREYDQKRQGLKKKLADMSESQ